jgi:hypothetical protein
MELHGSVFTVKTEIFTGFPKNIFKSFLEKGRRS